MKFYNDFSSMFNAQSGLKSDMSVFNVVEDNPTTKSFIVKDNSNNGAPVAEVFYDRFIPKASEEDELLDYVPLVGFNYWSRFYDSLGMSDAQRFKIDVIDYCEDHFGIGRMDFEDRETLCAYNEFSDVGLTKEQAEKLARHIDHNVNGHGSFYLI